MNILEELISLPTEQLIKKGIEYTPKEIERQPTLWLKNYHNLMEKKDEISSFLNKHIFSKGEVRTIMTGAGSSAYIGLSSENLLRKKWGIDVDTRPTTDIVTQWSSIFLKKKHNTLISFSRSGESPESIGAFQVAEKFCKKLNHIIITCNKDGSLIKLGKNKNNVLLLILSEETNDKGLAMTSSFSTMLIATQFLANVDNFGEYEKILLGLSQATELIFKDYSDLIKEVAETSFNRSVFLGNGCLYGCATEASLKMLEMTEGTIESKAETFLGIRHGPEVFINDQTLVVYFLSTDLYTRKYELDLMKEIESKDLGKRRIAVIDKKNNKIEGLCDTLIEFNKEGVFKIPDYYRPPMDVTIGQMLALFKALNLGFKPDNPSEKGIISRVVQGVKIYDQEYFEEKGEFRKLARVL